SEARSPGNSRSGISDFPRGLAWILVGCLLRLTAEVIGLIPIDFLALAAILYGMAWLIGGRTWARGLTFPILFLFFMFPLPVFMTERAAIWLQGIVTPLATGILQLFLPAYREGYFIKLPGQELEVGEACSGLRQVVAFAALTLLVAHLSRRP